MCSSTIQKQSLENLPEHPWPLHQLHVREATQHRISVRRQLQLGHAPGETATCFARTGTLQDRFNTGIAWMVAWERV